MHNRKTILKKLKSLLVAVSKVASGVAANETLLFAVNNFMFEKDCKVVCLKSQKITLRPFEINTDFELFMKWINDSDVVRFLLRTIPVYRHQQLAWFQRLPNATDVVFTIETAVGNTIGMIGLERINLVEGTAFTWQIIGERQNRGQGFGTDAKILLLDYAFNTLRLEKVCAEVIASNDGSLRYNQKSGFREEGRMRSQVFREGIRRDLVLLGILKAEFAEIWEQYKNNLVKSYALESETRTE